MAAEHLIGQVTHYFGKINVAIIELTDLLKVGDRVRLKGRHTDFEQEVTSIQIEHQQVPEAGAGNSIGLKVPEKVHEFDQVYRIIS